MQIPQRLQTILTRFDAEILEIKIMDNGNSDLIDAGVLWSTEAKSGIKYWSGKLNLSTILDALLDQAEDSSPGQKAIAKSQLEKVLGVGVQEKGKLDLGEKSDLDLMMFINNKRQPDKKDPHLQLKVKVAEQIEPVAEDDVPPF